MRFVLAVTSIALSFNVLAAQGATWNLKDQYQGSSFFDKWDFTVGIDANTTGNVLYQSKADAASQKLTFLNGAGNAIIKVDNTTVGQGNTFGRSSIKITSQATIASGSLLIMDAVHLPYGCSVWPAYWMQGPNWPNDGEIDIIENVNLATINRYSLHTLQGCTHPAGPTNGETGQIISTDCFNQTNGNQGCIVQENKPNSYGAGFASIGGGAVAMRWDSTNGIQIWYFPRGSIPADLSTTSPNPDGWGPPSADYPQSSCDTSKFFSPQHLILDITLCGNFAGAANVFQETCQGVCTDLIKTPTNYDNAYFEIAYIRHFVNTPVSGGALAATKGDGLAGNLVGAAGVSAGLAVLASSLFFA